MNRVRLPEDSQYHLAVWNPVRELAGGPVRCLSTSEGILALSRVFPRRKVSWGCHGLGAVSIKMAPVYSEHHSDGAAGLMGKPLRWRLLSQSSDLLSRTAQTEGRLV